MSKKGKKESGITQEQVNALDNGDSALTLAEAQYLEAEGVEIWGINAKPVIFSVFRLLGVGTMAITRKVGESEVLGFAVALLMERSKANGKTERKYKTISDWVKGSKDVSVGKQLNKYTDKAFTYEKVMSKVKEFTAEYHCGVLPKEAHMLAQWLSDVEDSDKAGDQKEAKAKATCQQLVVKALEKATSDWEKVSSLLLPLRNISSIGKVVNIEELLVLCENALIGNERTREKVANIASTATARIAELEERNTALIRDIANKVAEVSKANEAKEEFANRLREAITEKQKYLIELQALKKKYNVR